MVNTVDEIPDEVLRVDGLRKHFPVTKGIVLRKTIGWVRAVDDVNFTVKRGQTLAIVGESGCGKTTTTKVILRLEEPTEGHVYYEGKDVHALDGDELREYRKRVQAVFQDPFSSLSPRMRVRDIITEPLVLNQKVSRKEQRELAERVMMRVGLRPEQVDLYPHEFSGGQRQRIAVARALLSNPDLILLDEPVSALDVSVQAQIMNLLKDLQTEDQVSYLLVAHNLATVRYMAHEVVVMYLGQVVEHAETEELFEHKMHPYTEALFSAALSADPDVEREMIMLEGEVPSPINPPSGCRFHTRCPVAIEDCKHIEPELREIRPGHWAACIRL
jgi:oligopeptide/dipeptide ABC transporter ATP-binding protein